MIQISVVVPTCGRPALLDRCLGALIAQRFPSAAYEVIVADDDPAGRGRACVEAWAARASARGGPALRYEPPGGSRGPAAARNRGWRAARGAIIAFTDDDCIPARGWLAAGVRAFRHAGVAAVTGRVLVPVGARATDYERDVARLASAEFLTANCFCRREALAAVGGFDERFRLAWREDSDLQFSLLERGGEIVRDRRALVVHPVRPAGWGVSIRQQRRALFNALLFKKHRGLYRARIQPAPPWRYYLAVAAGAAAVAAAWAGHTPAALAFGAAWAWLTGSFCAARINGASPAWGHVAEMALTSAVIPPLAVFWRLAGAVRYRVVFF